jgi:hypothetical protein
MAGQRKAQRGSREDGRRGGYEVIVRGPDGRARFERVRDVGAYRELITRTKSSTRNTISIDEIARLLDT